MAVAIVKRVLIGVVIAAIGVTAYLMPAPDPEPEPLAGVIVDRLGIESPADAAIWYCPWAQSTTERDSLISLVSVNSAAAELTLPVLIPGSPPDQTATSMSGPGGAIITLSEVAQRGDSPGFIEFDGGPSAASVTVTGDVLAADACVARGTDEWFFVGGSTMTGDSLKLRLFNPFPESAVVTITAFSEIGTEVLGTLGRVTVRSRSWQDVEFAEQLRQRESLVISVRLESGLAVPAMSFSRGADEAWWSGTDVSTNWEMPIARVSLGDEAAIIIANPGLADVTADVEIYGTDAQHRQLISVDVAAGAPTRVDLTELALEFDAVGARVAASGPVVAGVVSVGPSGTAVTAGAPSQGTTWLLPGTAPTADTSVSLWLLNTSDSAIVVTVSRLTAGEVFNVNEILEPGTVTRIPVVGVDTLGYLVRSSDPFTASWTANGGSGLAVSGALLVVDE